MKSLIAILILAIVLIAGCTQTLSSVGVKQQTEQNFKCPYEDKIKEAIQKSFYERSLENNPYNPLTYGAFVEWNIPNATLYVVGYKDVRLIEDTLNIEFCKYGSEEGQNVNYLYCSASRMNDHFEIEQTIVSPEGIIKEKIIHKILGPVVIDTATNFTVVELKCEKIS